MNRPHRLDRRRVVAIVSAVLLVFCGYGLWQQLRPMDDQGQAAPTSATPAASATTTPTDAQTSPAAASRTPSATTGSATSPAAASSSPSASTPAAGSSSLPQGCSTTARPITPTRLTIVRMGIDAPVLSVGLADDGSIGTPPLDDPTSIGWFNPGPKPGAAQGQAILTAHTYHAGGALGNQLQSASGLRVGDVVKVSDGRTTLCYRYSGAMKVWVKDYDPNSTVIVNDHGAPRLVMVICWDWKPSKRSWDSRIVYAFEPLAA